MYALIRILIDIIPTILDLIALLIRSIYLQFNSYSLKCISIDRDRTNWNLDKQDVAKCTIKCAMVFIEILVILNYLQ